MDEWMDGRVQECMEEKARDLCFFGSMRELRMCEWARDGLPCFWLLGKT